jgi:hypothetical protein
LRGKRNNRLLRESMSLRSSRARSTDPSWSLESASDRATFFFFPY